MRIQLPGGITLTVDQVHRGATAITAGQLMDECPGCGENFCYFQCDGSHTLDDDLSETEEEARDRIEHNARVEGMISLIQNLYSAGFDDSIEEMRVAIERTIEDIGNQT